MGIHETDNPQSTEYKFRTDVNSLTKRDETGVAALGSGKAWARQSIRGTMQKIEWTYNLKSGASCADIRVPIESKDVLFEARLMGDWTMKNAYTLSVIAKLNGKPFGGIIGLSTRDDADAKAWDLVEKAILKIKEEME